MNTLKLWCLLVLLLVVIISTTESKRPGRKRPPLPSSSQEPPGPKRKKSPGRFPFLFRRGKHGRQRGSESKKVYYYSMPPKSTPRPRVILGEELNFLDIGILSKNSTNTPTNSTTLKSSSSNNHDIRAPLFDPYDNHDNLFHTDDFPPRPPSKKRPRGPPRSRNPRRRPRTRGPGYRLEGRPWQNHYVLHDSDEQLGLGAPTQDKKPPKVMDSMKRAANELRNAYKAALFQSAKMAKYTGNAAANYFKGVRNLIGGNDKRKQDTGHVLRIPEDLENMKINGDIEEVQDVQASENGSLPPNVYLDWGGSFWRLFYNKPGSGKSVEP